MSNIYNTIDSLCKSKGITGYKLCKDLNISRGIMTELRKGRTKNITTETAKKIADYFSVPVDYLLGNWLGSDTFAEKLILLCNEKNLSHADIATIIGVSESDVDKYKKGETFPSVMEVDKLSSYFNLPRDYFFPSTEKGQVIVKHYIQPNQEEKTPSETAIDYFRAENGRDPTREELTQFLAVAKALFSSFPDKKE